MKTGGDKHRETERQQELALSYGMEAAEACADKAERVSNFDRAAAKGRVVEKLMAEGKPISCEDLVDYCREHGLIPHDDHAFGVVFKELSKEKVIEKAGYGPRRKGHGAPGAQWWRLNTA